ncbi:hypothetical protein ACSPNK_002418 [Providencia stuartii]|uniref:hypothetical protein n=1 Tax=Providencia stuartii TaxID=588 RepID=UPI0013D167EB|nr:hypothetical protein [Providencia stuartii]
MEFKGTPAPWGIKPEEVDKPYIRIRGTRLGCRFKIANVLTPIYDGVHPREADETRCNARLIAAAPELLSELIRLRNIVASYKQDIGDNLDITDAVISKALGQQ